MTGWSDPSGPRAGKGPDTQPLAGLPPPPRSRAETFSDRASGHRPRPRPRRRRLGFQPALDGIRAVAVVAVMLFHAGMTWLPGGFLGVDLFFVLSGFLITTLLLEEWGVNGSIRLGAFWGRRA